MVSRKIRHPWDDWFRRKQFRLAKDNHYTCLPHSMAQQIRNEAQRRGLKVSIQIIGTTLVVTNRGSANA